MCAVDVAYNDLPAATRADSRSRAPPPSRVPLVQQRLTRRERNRLIRLVAQAETQRDNTAAVIAAKKLAVVAAAAPPCQQWLPLSATASGASLYGSYGWRKERLHEIQSKRFSPPPAYAAALA